MISQLHILRWRFHTTQHTLKSPNDVDHILATSADFAKGRVAIEPLTGRHRVEFEKVGQWYDGASPYIGSDVRFSYDGVEARHAKRVHHGQALPGDEDPPGSGRVKSQPDDFISIFGIETGLAFLPPYIITTTSVQDTMAVLKSKVGNGLSITTSSTDNSEWEIGFPDGEHDIRIRYSVSKGEVFIEQTFANGEPRQVWRRIVSEWSRHEGDDVWVPENTYMVNCLAKPPTMARVKFSDFKINSKVDDDTFRIAFPTGMLIDDEIKKKSYLAGQSPVDDRQSAERFRERHSHPAASDPSN